MGWSLVVGRAESGAALCEVVEEVGQDGVSGNRYREHELVAGVATLVAFRLAYEHVDLLRGSVDD
jgi:hypothetical protein